jgi:hypothetical protein
MENLRNIGMNILRQVMTRTCKSCSEGLNEELKLALPRFKSS